MTQAASLTASLTPSQKPASTVTPTLTSTQAPPIARTATISPTPTEDLSFFMMATCLPRDSDYQRGEVNKIIDGDTIEVQFEDGITNTVRYIGIDAPEGGYPNYEEAKQANADLVWQKEVILVKDQSETDQYGRLLRYAIVGHSFVNAELVETGFARAENYPPDEACKDIFNSAQQKAQQAMAGLWAATSTPEPYSGQVVILAVNKREEWVEIQNTGDYDVDLAGWNLVSERGHQECPLSGILQAGKILRIWALLAQGPGYSCGYTTPIWNNSQPDPAVLYNAQGTEVSRK